MTILLQSIVWKSFNMALFNITNNDFVYKSQFSSLFYQLTFVYKLTFCR